MVQINSRIRQALVIPLSNR